MNKGFTLIEIMIVVGMIAGIIGVITLLYVVGLKTWSAGDTRVNIRGSLHDGINAMVRDLRHAKNPTTVQQSIITFTAVDFESDTVPPPDATYRYYLYNASDPLPNPPYTADSYLLMRSKDSSIYGAGRVLVRDIARPTSRPFSRTGDLITINLQVTKDGQTIGLRTKVNRRN